MSTDTYTGPDGATYPTQEAAVVAEALAWQESQAQESPAPEPAEPVDPVTALADEAQAVLDAQDAQAVLEGPARPAPVLEPMPWDEDEETQVHGAGEPRFPRLAEYERLASEVLAARALWGQARTQRAEANRAHAAADAQRAEQVKATKQVVEQAEQAMGDYVRSTGMGDPEGVLRGTGQRLTNRAPKATTSEETV